MKRKEIEYSRILMYEICNISDRVIAKNLGISNSTLHEIRKRNNWKRKFKSIRSDYGVNKVNPEIQRENKLRYMRNYQYEIRNGIREEQKVLWIKKNI